MEPKRLEELLEYNDVIYINNHNGLKRYIVKSISTDTRSLKNDELFIALKGDRYDANQFIDKAMELGSSGIIFQMENFDAVRKIINLRSDVLFVGVNDTLKVFSKMAKNYLRGFNALKKLAITGSSGKTTMKGLISAVLSERYRTISSKKSYNNLVGVSETIFSIENKHEFYIQELGTNHPGEIAKLVDIVNPEAGLITNIGPAHIGYFGSIEGIAKEKKSLLLGLNRNKNAVAFINKDDSFSGFLEAGIKAEVIYYGIEKNSDVKVRNLGLNKSLFLYKTTEIELHLPGRHNVLNAVGAIAVGERYGILINKIKNALERYRPEEGRGSLIEINGIKIVDESYNANPLSVKASIDYLSELENEGKKYLVLGDMAELGEYSEKYHREIANYLMDANINHTFLIGKKTFLTYEECKSEYYRNRIKSEVKHFQNMDSILSALIMNLSRGDIVLIKGSRIMGLDRLVNDIKFKLSKK